MRAARYWMRLSRFFMIAARWSGVLQPVFHVGPGALDRVEVGA